MKANPPEVIPNNAGDVNSNQNFNQNQPLVPQNAKDLKLGNQNNSLNKNTNENDHLNIFFYHKKKGEADRIKIAEQLDFHPGDLDEYGNLKPHKPISTLFDSSENLFLNEIKDFFSSNSSCSQTYDADILRGCPGR